MTNKTLYAIAWCELYKIFGEWQDQERIDLMDSVLEAVKSDECNNID